MRDDVFESSILSTHCTAWVRTELVS
jgi:hypothetical protein